MIPSKEDFSEKIVSCKWCFQSTTNDGTCECDRCWEIRHRIENDLDISIIIMSAMILKAKRTFMLNKENL